MPRQCSACTRHGTRCKNNQSHISAVFEASLRKHRRKGEEFFMKQAALSNCNPSADCCGLCWTHLNMALALLAHKHGSNPLMKAAVSNLGKALVGASDVDWKSAAMVWDALKQ